MGSTEWEYWWHGMGTSMVWNVNLGGMEYVAWNKDMMVWNGNLGGMDYMWYGTKTWRYEMDGME